MAKRGLYANIHAKKKRIAAGSGEKMRRPRAKGVYIAQGDNVEVKGTKRMLATKSKKATWY